MMSEEIHKRMDLSRLKSLLGSTQNMEFLSPMDESVYFNAIVAAYVKMRHSEADRQRSIPANSTQPEIDNWLRSSVESFDLGAVFYIGISEFRSAPWVKVRVTGKTEDWLLPLYDKIRSRWISFAPLTLDRMFEVRDLEHEFITISGEISSVENDKI
jgi:uncharacterized membrane protein YjdF